MDEKISKQLACIIHRGDIHAHSFMQGVLFLKQPKAITNCKFSKIRLRWPFATAPKPAKALRLQPFRQAIRPSGLRCTTRLLCRQDHLKPSNMRDWQAEIVPVGVWRGNGRCTIRKKSVFIPSFNNDNVSIMRILIVHQVLIPPLLFYRKQVYPVGKRTKQNQNTKNQQDICEKACCPANHCHLALPKRLCQPGTNTDIQHGQHKRYLESMQEGNKQVGKNDSAGYGAHGFEYIDPCYA